MPNKLANPSQKIDIARMTSLSRVARFLFLTKQERILSAQKQYNFDQIQEELVQKQLLPCNSGNEFEEYICNLRIRTS